MINKEDFIEVKKINKKVIKLKEDIKMLEIRKGEIAKDKRNKLKPNYTYEVNIFIVNDSKRYSDLKEGDEYIVITATLQNDNEYIEFRDMFDSFTRPDSLIISVRYYMKYGVLFHEGGGYIILKDKVPCNKEDWENLKKGNIEKFLK